MSQVTGGLTGGSLQVAFADKISYGSGSQVALPDGFIARSAFKQYGALLDQCNLLYAATLTFVASTPQTLNLKSLANINGVAAAVVFARVRFLAVKHEGTVDGSSLILGAEGSANEWLGYLSPAGATELILPGTASNDGFVIRQAPNTTGYVVGSSSRLWKFLPSAHAFTAKVILAGADA